MILNLLSLALAAGSLAQTQMAWSASSKVNVTLFVMSRCPDARLCESVFDTVVDRVGSKINLEMGYIATRNQSDPLGFTCKHGELECSGNAHQLCLYKYLPLSTFYSTLDCQNYSPEDIGKISLTKRCAQASHVDWSASGVGGCIEGNEANKLLSENVQKTAAAGVTTSCTVRIQSTLVHGGVRECVVDGGVWRGCNDGHTAGDFVRVIDEEWRHLQHMHPLRL